MWAEYDENLKENPFFQEILDEHKDILQKTWEENWIICIPRIGTLEISEINIKRILDHILIGNDLGSFSTVSKKQVQVQNKEISTEENGTFSHAIRILFEETFYEGDSCKYMVWCIDRPLFIKQPFCNFHKVRVFEDLHDCIDFLWVESSSHQVLHDIQNLCTYFIENSSEFETQELQSQKDEIGILYSQCLQMLLRHPVIKQKSSTNEKFVDNLKLAVETFMQYSLKKKLITGIATFVSHQDSLLNKTIQNSNYITLSNLNILESFSDKITYAQCEIKKINNNSTILDKVNCLKKTFSALCCSSNDNQEIITSDLLLQIFIYLILKTDIHNWISNLIFITEFRFSSTNNSNNSNYLVTTLEAAIEYLKSVQFLDLKKSLISKVHENSTDLFDLVQLGDLENLNSSWKLKKEEKIKENTLCHPLCNCKKCKDAIKINRDLSISEVKNDKEQTLLIFASINNQITIVEFFLNNESDVNVQDVDGKTALHYAAFYGYQDVLLLLRSVKNVKVNVKDTNGNTALHLAVNNGHENCVKALIYSSEDIDVNTVNSSGNTALHLASKLAYLEIIQALVSETYAATSMVNKNKQTPLDVAHNLHVFNMIKKYSENEFVVLSSSNSENNDSKYSSELKNFFFLCKSDYGKTQSIESFKRINLLIRAIENNDKPLASFYLGFNENYDVSDTSFMCHPLCDCSNCSPNGTTGELDLTRENKHIRTLNINNCNLKGFTPLHIAAQFGRTSILRLLLDAKAAPNLKTHGTLYTPLHLACIYQRVQVVKELLNCSNIEINVQDHKGNTPLFYACLKNDCKIIEILIKNDADTNVKNDKGKTVWDECQEKMMYSVFKMLKMCTKNNVDHYEKSKLF